MTTGNREDYLINILRLTEGEGVAKTTELASYMGVSPASVSEMIKVLAKENLVSTFGVIYGAAACQVSAPSGAKIQATALPTIASRE